MQSSETVQTIVSLIDERYPTHADFEREMGLKPKTVNNWIRGTSSSFYRMLPELSAALDVTPNYLLGFSARELEADETEILSAYRRAGHLGERERKKLISTIKNIIDLKIK
ncbi:MAG: hypothetical protein IKA74_02695 [Clostridia bacterium]|nr:hypothetical protein [Clostridia bacterium]